MAAAFSREPRSTFERAYEVLGWADNLLKELPPRWGLRGYSELAGFHLARRCLSIAANKIADLWHDAQPHDVKVSRDLIGAAVVTELAALAPAQGEREQARQFLEYARAALQAFRELPLSDLDYKADLVFTFAELVYRDLIAILDRATPAPGEKTWTVEATVAWLDKHQLPDTFHWVIAGRQQPVRPAHPIASGYGFWLRETPYFPGLFEACHAVLAACHGRGIDGGVGLAARLRKDQQEAA